MSMASQVHTSSSSPATATEDDIRGLLVGLYRDKNVRRGLLVVHAQPRWDGPTAISVEDLMVPVHCCRTVLQLRDVIRHRNDPDTPWRVGSDSSSATWSQDSVASGVALQASRSASRVFSANPST